VTLYEEDGGEWTELSTTLSNASGDYEFGGLPAGTYYLEANAPAGGYAGEYYDNVGALVMNRSSATAIALGEGESQTGKDFALAAGGVIEGKVTDALTARGIEGVIVTVYEFDFGAVAGQTTTDSNGDYAVGNLPSGDYRISADAEAFTYTSQYYDGQPMTEEGKAASTAVQVTAGTTASNINFALEDKTFISGTVTDDLSDPGTPIEGAVVTAYNADWEPVESDTTAGDGTYEIHLEAGDYYVSAEALGYAPEYFREASQPGDAQQVSPNAPVTGVDFTLTPVGTILVVSNVQSAPFTLSNPDAVGDIEDDTGPSRIWYEDGLTTGTWTIAWGNIAGYDTPSGESKVLDAGKTITFFGEYTLKEGFKVNVLDTTGSEPNRSVRIQWYSEVGTMYQVQATDDLESWTWQNVGDSQAGTGALMVYEEAIGENVIRFLRLMAY
ncbi:carboxypeptidase regulatory-like domain-containing protein, partial [bacterium]|nr:carboxypeptidase regulatory-like domain-containing protein [bacterium]